MPTIDFKEAKGHPRSYRPVTDCPVQGCQPVDTSSRVNSSDVLVAGSGYTVAEMLEFVFTDKDRVGTEKAGGQPYWEVKMTTCPSEPCINVCEEVAGHDLQQFPSGTPCVWNLGHPLAPSAVVKPRSCPCSPAAPLFRH